MDIGVFLVSMKWNELKGSSPVQIHEPLILIQSNPADDPEAESNRLLGMINSLRKVDFWHPTGHYTWEKNSPPPLEKILGAPLRHENNYVQRTREGTEIPFGT